MDQPFPVLQLTGISNPVYAYGGIFQGLEQGFVLPSWCVGCFVELRKFPSGGRLGLATLLNDDWQTHEVRPAT